MEQQIKARLEQIERDYNVKILYAVESGSRAWGFASGNSDYDIRFIYVHNIDWYLTIQDRKDVIEVMEGDLDFAGWELGKALGLLRKSNPPLLEWLSSPVVYYSDPEAVPELRELAKGCYSPKNALYHYLHMAEGNYRSYIKDRDSVKLKKYLYVIRPLLGCLWIDTYATIPPVEIKTTLALLRANPAYPEVVSLIEAKASGNELDEGSPNLVLNKFIEDTLEFLKLNIMNFKTINPNIEALDKYLIKQIMDKNAS